MNHAARFVALAVLSMCGCASSRWAMDDTDYRAKYSRPYAEGEKLPRMAKQMIDARHVAGKGGAFANVVIADDPLAGGAELGLFHYPVAWFEQRAAVAGLLESGRGEAYAGATAGFRLQPPTRLAPFAGIGGFVGFNKDMVNGEFDGLDNDDDWFIDEPGEMRDEGHALAAIFPEVGAHFWITPSLRLTGSASYYMTTRGRDEDFWFFGAGLAWMPGY